MKSGASQSSYNSKANEAPKLATNNKFAALRDWIGGAPTYFVATPSWKANLRNFSAASPLKKSWKKYHTFVHGLFKERLLLQLHHIQQARTTILLKNMLSMRLWKRNKYKKAPNISRFEQKNKNCKAKNANWVFSVSVHLQNMEAKLAEYRAKKSAEQAVVERKSKIWNLFTLKFLRGDDENYATNQDALEENIEGEAY